jgi:low affinity Fe/Cu permease
MDTLVVVIVAIVAVVLVGGGYYLATHQHQLAVATATAINRATTIPSGDVAAIHAKLDAITTAVSAAPVTPPPPAA